MKHISEIIAIKKVEIEHGRQLSLFTIPHTKGSGEWKIFGSPVAHDHTDAYRVNTPRRLPASRFSQVPKFNPYIHRHTLKYAQ